MRILGSSGFLSSVSWTETDYDHLEGLLKQLAGHQAWARSSIIHSAFLTSSRVLVMLLVWGQAMNVAQTVTLNGDVKT